MIRKILIGLLLVIPGYMSLLAQNQHDKQSSIDSLENTLYNSLSYNLQNSDKIDICIQLAELYTGISFEKQVEYAARSLVLSEEINSEENIIQSLNILSQAYFHLDNYQKSIEYATRLYNIRNTNGDNILAADALTSIARNYFGWSKYIEARDYYNRALLIYKDNSYFKGIAQTHHSIAMILGNWGEYDEALSQSQDALEFWEEVGDKKGLANSYNGIGRLYKELGNYESAHDYYKKSLELFKELGDKFNIVNLTLHIGDIYLKKELYDKALEYYFRAENIGRELQHKKLHAITLSNIGEAYNLKGNYEKALDYQKRSLVIKEEIGDKMRLAITYNEMGVIYMNLTEFDKALEYLSKALVTSQEINFKYQINICHKNISLVYQKTKNFEESLFHFQKYIEGKESIHSEENKQTIAELQAKYEVERRKKENERLRHNQQLNKAQIRNQQLLIGFVLFILLGSFVLAIIFQQRYRQNKRLNIELSLKNRQVEDQQKNVEILNAELQETNASKDKFLSIVAHDLKNPFNAMLVLSNMLLEDYDSIPNEERKQYIEQIYSSAENTYSLLQNLLDWAKTQSNKVFLKQENIDMHKMASDIVNQISTIARTKNINLISMVPAKTTAFADKNMIATVLLNLVSNAIKFTPQNGHIEVKTQQENGHLEVMVEDTGVGISQENLAKLFKPDVKFHTMGTNREKGTGLGLLLCKEFVEKNGGQIWVKSELGKGSRFFFSIPLPQEL